MFRQATMKQKIEVKDPKHYYCNKILKRYSHIGTSIKDNTVIKSCVQYDRYSNRMIVRLVKYHTGGNFIIIYSYNQSYKSKDELRKLFFSKWEKPSIGVNPRNY